MNVRTRKETKKLLGKSEVKKVKSGKV